MNWYKSSSREPFSEPPEAGSKVYIDNEFGEGIATGKSKKYRNGRTLILVHFSYETINKPRADGVFVEYDEWVPLDACSRTPTK